MKLARVFSVLSYLRKFLLILGCPICCTAQEWQCLYSGVSQTVSSSHDKIGWQSEAKNDLGARANFASVLVGDTFFVFGGMGVTDYTVKQAMDDMMAYDLNTKHWFWLSGAQRDKKYTDTVGICRLGDKLQPAPREGAVLAKFDDNIFLYGGQVLNENGSIQYVGDLWRFDYKKLQWTLLKPAITSTKFNERANPNFAILGNRLILHGGHGINMEGNYAVLNDSYAITFSDSEYTAKPVFFNEKSNEDSRYAINGIGATMFEAQGKVYLIDAKGQSCYILDSNSNQWRQDFSEASLNVAKHFDGYLLNTCTVGNTTISYGGWKGYGENTTTMNSISCYEHQQGKTIFEAAWETPTEMPTRREREKLPQHLAKGTMFYAKGWVYLMGGYQKQHNGYDISNAIWRFKLPKQVLEQIVPKGSTNNGAVQPNLSVGDTILTSGYTIRSVTSPINSSNTVTPTDTGPIIIVRSCEAISLYPIPAKQNLNIRSNDILGMYDYFITAIPGGSLVAKGKVTFSAIGASVNIDIGTLNTGNYSIILKQFKHPDVQCTFNVE